MYTMIGVVIVLIPWITLCKTTYLHHIIILITLFCILKITELCDEFPQNITLYDNWVKKGMINDL
jgi:hypothetical protein